MKFKVVGKSLILTEYSHKIIEGENLFDNVEIAVPKSLFSIFTLSKKRGIIKRKRVVKKMRKAYPSDITREQFEIIREELEGAKKKTHPRKYELYDIFCAILYMLKEGCSWRGIPHDYPNWQNVRYHYDIWSKPDDDGISLLDLILRKLVEMERKENNRSEQTTMIIIDSKSIQNADTAESKGYDAGKKLRE